MKSVYVLDDPIGTNENIRREKIGYSTDTRKRIKTLNTSRMPAEELKFFAGIKYPNNYDSCSLRNAEQYVHYQFSKFRPFANKEFFEFPKNYNLISHLRKITDELSKLQQLNCITLTRILGKSIDDFEDENERDESDYSYQEPHINKVVKYFESNDEGGIWLPTGYGKTFIVVKSAHILKYKKLVILCPKIIICQEWLKALKLYHKREDIVIINSDETHMQHLQDDHKIYVCTYQSMVKYRKEYGDLNFIPDCIVYDEAHHVMTENEYSTTLEIGAKKRMLCTATPRFMYNEHNYNLKDKFGTACQVNLHDAINQNILADYIFFIYDNDLEHIKELTTIYNRKHILIFFSRVEESKEMCKKLSKLGYNTFHVDSQTKNKSSIIKQFEEEGGILCNVDIVSEGVSIIKIDSIIFCNSPKSQEAIQQKIGRGLRKDGDKYLIISVMEDMEVSMSALFFNDAKSWNESTKYKLWGKGDLDKFREKVGMQIGMLSRNMDIFTYKCEICKEYERDVGEIIFRTVYKGIRIGIWINTQLQKYKKNRLSEDKFSELKGIESFMKKVNNPKTCVKYDFDEMIKLCKEHEKNVGKITAKIEYKGIKIGYWICSRLRDYKKNKLSQQKIKLLGTVKRFKDYLSE